MKRLKRKGSRIRNSLNNLRVVLDTNVIISAFLKPQSLPRRVLDHVLQEHVFLISLDTFGELRECLLHKKFDRYVSRTLRLRFLRLLPTLAEYGFDKLSNVAYFRLRFRFSYRFSRRKSPLAKSKTSAHGTGGNDTPLKDDGRRETGCGLGCEQTGIVGLVRVI